MVSSIRVEEDKIDVMNKATDMVRESTGTRLRQSEFLELLLDSDPKEIAGIIVKNMRKKMDKVKN